MEMNETTLRVSRALRSIAGEVAELVEIVAPGGGAPFTLVVYTQGRGSHIGNAPRVLEMAGVETLLARWEMIARGDPIDPEKHGQSQFDQESLRIIAGHAREVIKAAAGEDVAFSLILYADGSPVYVGTCKREEAVRELGDLLAYWRAGPLDVPAHELT